MIMDKDEAIEYIKAVGHSTETAKYMLKGLSDPFDMEEDVMPDSVYDTIVDGITEVSYRMSELMGTLVKGE